LARVVVCADSAAMAREVSQGEQEYVACTMAAKLDDGDGHFATGNTSMSAIEPYTCTSRSGQTILIRTARPLDALAIHTITAQAIAEGAYHISEPQEFTFTLEDEEAWIHQHAEHPAQVMLVAEGNDEAVGMIHFEPGARKRQAHTGESAMNVAPAWREQGVGHCLLDALIAWATTHPQIERVGLRALSTNTRALQLYAAVGFVEEGRRIQAIKLAPGQYADEVLMSRPVKSL
jgi:RimJ/RimL family protein N-acetyltransferase